MSKILRWFKNQQTAVGILMKSGKSGQGDEALSSRKKWQLASFSFLRQHIVPRTYARDTGVSVVYFVIFYLYHTYHCNAHVTVAFCVQLVYMYHSPLHMKQLCNENNKIYGFPCHFYFYMPFYMN